MPRNSPVSFLIVLSFLSVISSELGKGSYPVLQRTVEILFGDRSGVTYPGACKWIRPSKRQGKICRRDYEFPDIIATAKAQAISSCEETFKYDRWNCSIVFNNKTNRNIFSKVYRETAFVYALTAASLSHSIAKGCAAGNLVQCSCTRGSGNNPSQQWRTGGCGDDFRYGRRITKNFLDYKHAGNDQIAEVLRQDILVGIETIGEQLREVCKCHGFSGSCTTKTCWKRLTPFSSAMGSLKKNYHHAVKKKMINYTTKRAITPKVRKKLKLDRKSLMYIQKTPNLCARTSGRICKDQQNCATLCCGRGYKRFEKSVESRCKCRIANCCYVKCDTCKQNVEYFVCK